MFHSPVLIRLLSIPPPLFTFFAPADTDYRRALSKATKAEDKVKAVQERIKLFEAGEVKALHQINSKEHAQQTLDFANIAVEEAKEVIIDKEEIKKKCRTRRKQKSAKWMRDCTSDLIERYAKKGREDVVERYRTIAYRGGGAESLRRPWDPTYNRWKKKYAKDEKKRIAKQKEEKFRAALLEIEKKKQAAAKKLEKGQREEIPAYAYDNSVMGQLKVSFFCSFDDFFLIVMLALTCSGNFFLMSFIISILQNHFCFRDTVKILRRVCVVIV